MGHYVVPGAGLDSPLKALPSIGPKVVRIYTDFLQGFAVCVYGNHFPDT